MKAATGDRLADAEVLELAEVLRLVAVPVLVGVLALAEVPVLVEEWGKLAPVRQLVGSVPETLHTQICMVASISAARTGDGMRETGIRLVRLALVLVLIAILGMDTEAVYSVRDCMVGAGLVMV